jgi:hypothetical protein
MIVEILTSKVFLYVSGLMSLTYGWVQVYESCQVKQKPIQELCAICSEWGRILTVEESTLRCQTCKQKTKRPIPPPSACHRCRRPTLVFSADRIRWGHDESCLVDHCEPTWARNPRAMIRYSDERSER